jgi:ribosome recycling factor
MRGVTFQDALEIIESLPEEQRESLMEIVKHRLIEERRDRLAQIIKEAKEEYKNGEFKKGTIEDLLRDLEK